MHRLSYRSLAPFIIIGLFVTACGSDDSTASTGTESASASNDAPADEPAEAAASASGGGAGTATLTLDNGEVHSFNIACMLEPQDDFDFSIGSYDEPYNLDFSQWSADSGFSGPYVEVIDTTDYEILWGAETGFGIGELVVTQDGSTMTATGTFAAGGNPDAETVQGELIARC